MKQKNTFLIIAGVINLTTFFLHLIGGQLSLVDPMLDSSLGLQETSELVGAWHMVTFILLVTSYILLSAGYNKKYSTNTELIEGVGHLNLAFCLPSIIASFYYGILVPQWIFFLPIGVLTMIGVNKMK